MASAGVFGIGLSSRDCFFHIIDVHVTRSIDATITLFPVLDLVLGIMHTLFAPNLPIRANLVQGFGCCIRPA